MEANQSPSMDVPFWGLKFAVQRFHALLPRSLFCLPEPRPCMARILITDFLPNEAHTPNRLSHVYKRLTIPRKVYDKLSNGFPIRSSKVSFGFGGLSLVASWGASCAARSVGSLSSAVRETGSGNQSTNSRRKGEYRGIPILPHYRPMPSAALSRKRLPSRM